ncbi:MAG TPA: hypothetical protein PKD26_11930 [Pyrinomonadaceae bacterium]|nr:hypothetical protein [Pyrinomonadaceae bacterium]
MAPQARRCPPGLPVIGQTMANPHLIRQAAMPEFMIVREGRGSNAREIQEIMGSRTPSCESSTRFCGKYGLTAGFANRPMWA